MVKDLEIKDYGRVCYNFDPEQKLWITKKHQMVEKIF